VDHRPVIVGIPPIELKTAKIRRHRSGLGRRGRYYWCGDASRDYSPWVRR